MIRWKLEIGTAVALAFSNVLIFFNLAFRSVFLSPIIKKSLSLWKHNCLWNSHNKKFCILLLFVRSSHLIYALFRSVFWERQGCGPISQGPWDIWSGRQQVNPVFCLNLGFCKCAPFVRNSLCSSKWMWYSSFWSVAHCCCSLISAKKRMKSCPQSKSMVEVPWGPDLMETV